MFPKRSSVARRVVLEPDHQNFGPEVFIARVWLDHGQVIDGRDDTAIEDDEVVFPWGEDDPLLTSSRGKQQEGNGPDATEAA